MLGGLVAVLAVVYALVLLNPLPLPWVKYQAEQMLHGALPETTTIVVGEAFLAIEGGIWPVLRFEPVTVTDTSTGGVISMASLDVGFSPVRALFGQPAANVTLIEPHLQIVQDLLGPQLSGFDVVEPTDGTEPFVRVRQGAAARPNVSISANGISVDGTEAAKLTGQFRSDNDWMIANILAADEGLANFRAQTDAGYFSRLRIRNATIEMHDSVYGLFRKLENVSFDMVPTLDGGVKGTFTADLAGRTIKGTVKRSTSKEGAVTFTSSLKDLDFASLLSFLDDPDSLLAVKGAGDLNLSVVIDPKGQVIESGRIGVDLTGARLRVKNDYFPIATRNLEIDWDPQAARYAVDGAYLEVGKSSGTVSGVFMMGLDKTYGPTLSMSLSGRDVILHPNDMLKPSEPFEEISFSGWSAPLYGALGIDKLVAVKPGVVVSTAGRADFLRAGIGFDLTLGGAGASADDFKRLWPYFLIPGARDWFVQNVSRGQVESSNMRFKFPVGSVSTGDEDKPVPPGAITIDLQASDVRFTPLPTMEAVDVAGTASIEVRDNVTTLAVQGGEVQTADGPVSVKDGALIIDTGSNDVNVFELSGDVLSTVRSLVSLAREHFPEALASVQEALDLSALRGSVAGSMVATLTVGRDDVLRNIDYAANGAIGGFYSEKPIEGYSVSDGQLTFAVSQDGYAFNGDAKFNGFDATIGVNGSLDKEPDVLVSSTLSVKQIADIGIDLTSVLDGSVRFAARPVADGSLQIAADLEQTGVNIRDLGIVKKKGVPGKLALLVRDVDGDMALSDVVLQFADVDVRGAMKVNADAGLKSAEFSTFKLSEGDDANLSIASGDDGIDLKLRGQQLDLKPMLRRFFGLQQTSTGGPQSTQFGNAINLDVELRQAIGFYSTTAFNLDLKLALVGEDLRNVSMQAQFSDNSSVSIATNPNNSGRTMSVAFNDLGTLLRYLNVYPRLLGGQGSMTLVRDEPNKLDRGTFSVRDFALVDEEKVAQILGNHSDSRKLIAEGNKLSFNAGQAKFIRRSDRIEVEEAVLDGDTTGGTMRGFVYTKARQYDLTGTYVPLFALNTIFQKLPIIGQILGGRDGEGLVGVTFAVRGDLDDPQFVINPASLLLPGAFRGLMEFRAKEAPRELVPNGG